jgi:predicted AAA+ superfamily ATPase
MRTVKDACILHDTAIHYSMKDQIENLHELINGEKDGSAFFEKNYITHGMEQLFRQGLKRLAGKSKDTVFQLTQAMGGGKTHLMIAFGLLAKHPELRKKAVPAIAQELDFGAAKIVAFTGRNNPRHFFWGEIAHQLGKAQEFTEFWVNGARSPDENDWIKLIGEESVLILLDEMPPYFDNALTIPVGSGNLAQVATYALATLMSAALRLPRLCLVISNLSGTYEGASRNLSRAVRDVLAEANRQARPITPVQLGGNEIYAILRKRMFKALPPEEHIDRIAEAYANTVGEAERARSIAKSTEQIAAEIHASYPFHPGLKDVIAMFKENESFRQTRGLMRFVSRILKSVWERAANNVYLIGAQHLDMNDPEVREEVLNICNLQSAVAMDADFRRSNQHLFQGTWNRSSQQHAKCYLK